jgi:hypothetical protein
MANQVNVRADRVILISARMPLTNTTVSEVGSTRAALSSRRIDFTLDQAAE